MLSRCFLVLCLSWAISSCSSASETSGGESGGIISGPGPLVDNTQWVPSDRGEEFFGAPPDGAECELMPIDCPEFPWPEDECVDFADSSNCAAAFVPECLDTFTVLAVYTRMEDTRVPLCDWLTLEQPSLRAIRAGDQVEVRTRHSPLTAPFPGTARMGFVIGDEQLLDYSVSIPAAPNFPDTPVWTALKDYPAGTPILFHVDNHGSNEYMLIEANIL